MNHETKRSVGLIGATSMVVGSMVGSGILIISSKISIFGGLGLLAWALSSVCAMSLAYSFSKLSSMFKDKTGIPYYSYKAFGQSSFVGFHVAWAHWLGMCLGCATVAIAFSDYLFIILQNLCSFSNFMLVAYKFIAALGIVYFLTFMNIRSKVFSIALITFITIAKVALLLLLVVSALPYFSFGKLCIPSQNPSVISTVLAAMPLALFAFLGLESATASGDSVKDPQRTLPLATLVGTLIAAGIFMLVHISVMSVLPFAQQIASQTPVADVANITLGSFGTILVSIIACTGLIGSVNGLIFVSSYILYSSATHGWVSPLFALLSKKAKFPLFSGIATCLVTGMTILLYFLNMFDMRNLVYVVAFMLIFVYLMGTLAYGKLHKFNLVFLLNMSVCLVMLYGCGIASSAYFLMFMLPGTIMFLNNRKKMLKMQKQINDFLKQQNSM